MYTFADSRTASAMGESLRQAMAHPESDSAPRRAWLRSLRPRVPVPAPPKQRAARMA